LERDIPQLGISIPAMTIRRFWTMTAHFHGQIWNAAEFARSGMRQNSQDHWADLKELQGDIWTFCQVPM
jgi:hypothetical protein